jgi:hypothetical protein
MSNKQTLPTTIGFICGALWLRAMIYLFIFVVALHLPSLRAQSIGTLTITNSLGWDAPVLQTNETFVAYRIYVGPTNGGVAGLKALGDFGSNRWPGTSARLDGPYLVALKTVANVAVTNVSTMTLTNIQQESESFSEVVIVTFRAGVPLPPNNLQLYSVITAASTNALPVVK